MVFKNEAQLKNFLLAKCKNAIAQAEQKIYQTIDMCLDKFYGEFTPAEYIRTKQLLYSLVRSGVKQIGNGFVAEVYFDASKLNYNQGMMELQHTSEHGMYGWATWTGQTVLSVAMESNVPHGGYAGGTSIWSESMAKLGDIFDLLKRELMEQGVPIKQ